MVEKAQRQPGVQRCSVTAESKCVGCVVCSMIPRASLGYNRHHVPLSVEYTEHSPISAESYERLEAYLQLKRSCCSCTVIRNTLLPLALATARYSLPRSTSCALPFWYRRPPCLITSQQAWLCFSRPTSKMTSTVDPAWTCCCYSSKEV